VKGNLLLANPDEFVDQAEMHFSRSLELSRQQGARLWELRPRMRGHTPLHRKSRSHTPSKASSPFAAATHNAELRSCVTPFKNFTQCDARAAIAHVKTGFVQDY
jgi:hypothetical protein